MDEASPNDQNMEALLDHVNQLIEGHPKMSEKLLLAKIQEESPSLLEPYSNELALKVIEGEVSSRGGDQSTPT